MSGKAMFTRITQDLKRGWCVLNPTEWSLTKGPTVLPKYTKGLLVPICYADKWVLCVVRADERTFLVYDPLRTWASANRKVMMKHVASVLTTLHKRKKVPQTKACGSVKSVGESGEWVIGMAAELMSS